MPGVKVVCCKRCLVQQVSGVEGVNAISHNKKSLLHPTIFLLLGCPGVEVDKYW